MKSKTLIIAAVVVAASVLLLSYLPARGSKVDTRIEDSAKQSYIFKTYLKGDDIKIQSTDGVVTLTGTVEQENHKSMAAETVTNLPGVTKVNNEIKVTGTPAGTGSDFLLAERIRGTLLFRRSVSFINTDVSVVDGNVTLKGKASSEAQKQLTSEYAKDISGVKSVDNQLVVTNAPETTPRTADEKIDDASITTQVRMALLFHHGTDVFDTKVSTNKGVVTLSGSAKNQAEIDLASKRVNDINGVTKVINNMNIEASASSSTN